MHATLVRIGNSQGVRIPKPLIEQLGLGEHLDLQVEAGALVIRPATATRAGWAEAARACAAEGAGDLADWDAATTDHIGDWQ